jgi:hypothetical protein
MLPDARSLRSILFGHGSLPGGRRTTAATPLLVCLASFVAYASGLFRISGGVVFIPGQAAVLGALVAVGLGSLRVGVGYAWLTLFGALFGYSLDHYLLGLSYRPWMGRIEALLGLDMFVYLGLEAVVLGTLAWLVGYVLARLVEGMQNRRAELAAR